MNKLTLLILSSMLFYNGLQAQLLNPNFENWSKTAANKDTAHSWSSTNFTVNAITSMITTLTKSTSAQNGSSAAELNTTPFGFTQTPVVGILVNGNAQLNFDAVSTSYISGGGCSISSNPTSLDGYYKITGSYSALVTVLISKYNTTLNKRDTLALNSISLAATASTYTAFSLPITYGAATIGDTATIVIYSSDPSVLPSINCQFSQLYIDNLNLVENVPDGSIAGIGSFMQNDTVNTTQNVEAWIYNAGTVNISNFDLTYTINGSNATTETFSGTILPGDSSKHTFSQAWTPLTAGSYDLCVYLDGIANDVDLSNDTSCVGFYSNLSLRDFENPSIKIFPNPAKDKLSIHISEPFLLIIYNSSGAEMQRTASSSNLEINTSHYANGIYQLRVVNPKTGEPLDNFSFMINH